MKRIFFLSITFYSLCCSSIDHSDHDLAVSLKQGVEQSTVLIIEKNKTIYASLEAKLHEPATNEKALIWLPKAEKAKGLTNDLLRYIDSLKEELTKESGLDKDPANADKQDNINAATIIFNSKGRSEELNARLAGYREKILSIDEGFKFARKDDIDKIIQTGAERQDNLFKNKSTLMSLLILSNVENRVRIAENKIISFCDIYCANLCGLNLQKFSAIATQSSRILAPGDELRVYAGVGSFSDASKPSFTINGRPVKIDENWVADYRFRVSNKPGNYSVPVTIKYTRPDGTLDEKIITMDYTVFDTTKIPL